MTFFSTSTLSSLSLPERLGWVDSNFKLCLLLKEDILGGVMCWEIKGLDYQNLILARDDVMRMRNTDVTIETMTFIIQRHSTKTAF